jgi:hypothetical protein
VSFFLAGFIASAIPVVKTKVLLCAIHPFALKVKLNC